MSGTVLRRAAFWAALSVFGTFVLAVLLAEVTIDGRKTRRLPCPYPDGSYA